MACRIHRKPRKKMSIGGILGSTVTGAATGAAAGGIGAIPGAAVGLVGGVLSHINQKKQSINEADMLAKQNRLQRQQAFNSSLSPSIRNTTLLPMGGLVPYNQETVELEKGEPFQTPDGQINKISDQAPTHAQGGVPITLPSGTKVLGKKPATDEKTFKQLGSKLERQQKKYQKILENNPSRIEEQTAQRMIDKVNTQFNELFTLQGEDVGRQQFPNGGAVGFGSNYDDTFMFTPEQIRAASDSTVISQQTLRDPNNNQVIGYESYLKGVEGPQYDFLQEGLSVDDQLNVDTTNTTLQKKANGGMIRRGALGLQSNFGDPMNNQGLLNAEQNINYGGIPNIQQPNINFNNALGTAASLAPVAYNLYQGLQKPEQVATNSFRNPYESEIRATMRDRRYNATPEIEAARTASATYNRSLRGAAPSQSQYLGGLQAGAISEQRQVGQALANKQNIDNQYLAQQAQVDMSLGQADAQRQQYIEDINARSRAAGRQFTGQGLSQLGQFAQVKQQQNNQMMRDMQRLNLLPALVQNFELGADGQWIFKQTGEVVDPVDVQNYVKGQ